MEPLPIPDASSSSLHHKTTKAPRPSGWIKPRKIKIHVGDTRYPIIEEVSKQLGYRVTTAKACTIYWHDYGGISMDALVKLDSDQKVNHFPGMSRICQKCRLAAALQRFSASFPAEYNFHPQTWSVPMGYKSLCKWFKEHRRKRRRPWLIVKPDGGCQGEGIFLTNALEDIDPEDGKTVAVQQYIEKPLTVNGYKFDMRIYVLVTSVTPVLRAFIHKEGLARFCTSKYQQPADGNKTEQYMHLTNYSINKTNYNFKTPGSGDASYSKWTLSQLFKHLKEHGVNTTGLWEECKDIVRKTLLSILPSLSHEYLACFGKSKSEGGYRCFEVLGFDIILDEQLKPWLLEVNHSPSLHCDTDLDTQVKSSVVRESLLLGSLRRQDVLLSHTPTAKDGGTDDTAMSIPKQTSAPTNQEECLDEAKVQELRTQCEDALLSGFDRIYPLSTASVDNFSRRQELYTRIEQHKGTLLKESLSVQRRREYTQLLRRERELNEALERERTKNRKPWGSSCFTGSQASKKLTQKSASDRAPGSFERTSAVERLKLKGSRRRKTASKIIPILQNHRKASTPRRMSVRVQFIPPRKTLSFPET